MGMDPSASLVFGFTMPKDAYENWELMRVILDPDFMDRAESEYLIERHTGEWHEYDSTDWRGTSVKKRYEVTNWELKTSEELEDEGLSPLPQRIRDIAEDEEVRDAIQKIATIGPLTSGEEPDIMLYMSNMSAGCSWGPTRVGDRNALVISDEDYNTFMNLITDLGIQIEGEPAWYMAAEFS